MKPPQVQDFHSFHRFLNVWHADGYLHIYLNFYIYTNSRCIHYLCTDKFLNSLNTTSFIIGSHWWAKNSLLRPPSASQSTAWGRCLNWHKMNTTALAQVLNTSPGPSPACLGTGRESHAPKKGFRWFPLLQKGQHVHQCQNSSVCAERTRNHAMRHLGKFLSQEFQTKVCQLSKTSLSWSHNHRITESSSLEETFELIYSNHQRSSPTDTP